MALELSAVTFDAADAAAVAAFWGSLLGRAAVPDPCGILLPGAEAQVGLRFVSADSPKTGTNPLHLHLTSTSLQDQQATVRRTLELGGRHVDVGQLPDETHVVLADPGGNEFCVIEPGNDFLAGCGFLAEVARREGTRGVGLFWRDALGWPLVWDHHEETAIQSARGGTKLSWGGEAVTTTSGRSRQRLDLAADNSTAEANRLVELGAALLSAHGDRIELTDPDGNGFSIRHH